LVDGLLDGLLDRMKAAVFCRSGQVDGLQGGIEGVNLKNSLPL
jgi:hypothetical protein